MVSFRVYTNISWFQSIHFNKGIVELLNDFFPNWTSLASWYANTQRIYCWEHGNFSDLQRKKLSPLFNLDGPDQTATGYKSLKFAEPTCYQHVQIHPQSTECLEALLNVLYKAHSLGSGALDLFILFCVDNCANDIALSVVDSSLETNDDSHCIAMFRLVKVIKSQSSLDHKIDVLVQVLAFLKSCAIPEFGDFSIAEVARHVTNLMEAARESFCAQLDKSVAEYMGMLIWKLGTAIKGVSWMHAKLPTEFLDKLDQLP